MFLRSVRFSGVFLAGALLVTFDAFADKPASRHFAAVLTGDQEVPPRVTPASGRANFQLSPDGLQLRYQLIVHRIDNVVAAHIHSPAPAGTNTGVVVFLAGNFTPGGGRSNGLLATGTITASDLINSLAGQPLSALIDSMRAGTAYVNVHTNDGVAPTNQGPGDFPGGEIRGQIRSTP